MQNRHSISLKYLAIIGSLTAFCWQCAACSETSKSSMPYRLQATFSEHGNKLQMDTPYHVESELGAAAYANGDLKEAEEHYRAALSYAENGAKLDPERHALLLTNLAAVLRDERKYAEAEKLFQQAVSIARISLQGRQPVLDYIARHFSACLSRDGKESDAAFIEERAKQGFSEIREKSVDLTSGLSTDVQGWNSATSTTPISADDGLVNYSLKIEPIDSHANGEYYPDWMAKKFATCNGTVDFYVDSQFRPLHLTCKIPPNSLYAGHVVLVTETYWGGNIRMPVINKIMIVAPCNIEATSFESRVPFLGKAVVSNWRFEKPDHPTTGLSKDDHDDGMWPRSE